MKKITKDSDVQQLLKSVEKEYQDAVASDAKLKKYFDDVNAAVKQSTETTVQATQSSETQGATPAASATTAQK